MSIAGSRPFLSIPDVVRERIYAYVLTVNVPDSSPWITPLPAIEHIRNTTALASLPAADALPRRNEIDLDNRLIEEAVDEVQLPATSSSSSSSCLAILVTCRTILLEAFHLWYQNNTLNFTSSKNIYPFLMSIGPVRANEIRSLRFDLAVNDWDNAEAQFGLSRLMKLERLTVVRNIDHSLEGCSYYTYGSYRRLPSLTNGLRGLKEINVISYGMTSEAIVKGIEQSKEALMRPRKKARKPPTMVDLFGRLKHGKETASRQSKQGSDEANDYAPDLESTPTGGEG